MCVIKFLLQLVLRIILIPIWIVLFLVWITVSAIVRLGSIAEGIISSMCILFLLFTLIENRTEWWRYGLFAVSEGSVVLVLFAGVLVEELLSAATVEVGGIILFGF